MKKFLRVGVLCAAVAALALGNITSAGAGEYPTHGTISVTPDPAEVGTTVVIANADDEDSLCEDFDGEEVAAYVIVGKVGTNEFDQYANVIVDNDTGSWEVEVTIPNDDAAIGEWVADALCDETSIAAFPTFWYELAYFDVIGEATPDVPEDDVAPAEEVVTAPRFTG